MKTRIAMVFALAVLAGVLCTGCMNKAQRQAVAKIDSLLVLNTQVYEELSAVNSDSIKILYDTVKKYDRIIGTADFSKDIDSNTLMLLYEYGTIDKTFKKFLGKHYQSMLDNLKIRRMQLENLKQDIENRLIDGEKLAQYLHTEDSLMQFTASDIRGRIRFLEQHKQMYYRYQPEIVKLTDSIEKHR
ncbi:MAG: hypothetical protein KA793_06110 [Bacteroidales bacterium]|nr:hypothetical protein [Bacteroidales bacterium]